MPRRPGTAVARRVVAGEVVQVTLSGPVSPLEALAERIRPVVFALLADGSDGAVAALAVIFRAHAVEAEAAWRASRAVGS